MRQLTTRLSNSVQLRFRSKTQVTNTLEKFRLSMNLGNGTWAITKEKSNQKLNLKKSGPPKRMKKFRQNPIITRSLVVISIQKSKQQVCLLYTSPSPRDRQKSRMP